MKQFAKTQMFLALIGMFLCHHVNGQHIDLKGSLENISAALESNDQQKIETTFDNLKRTLRKIKSREQKTQFFLVSSSHLIAKHPENPTAHQLTYELLNLARKTDRKKQFSPEIIEQIKAFNLLIYDSEMIENNVALVEKIDKENAQELSKYLRNNSKLNQRIKLVERQKEDIESTIEEVTKDLHDELALKEKETEKIQNLFSRSMDSMQLVTAIDSLKIISLFAIAGALLLMGLLYYNLVRSSRKMKRQKKQIEEEKEKYEELLLNILPAKVATELKEHGSVEPQHYDQVTVFFADFVNFSKITKTLTKEQLIKDLNDLFSIFDDLTDRYQIEKIKTIGDAYMCVSGLPDAKTHSAIKVIQFSKDIIEALKNWNKERNSVFLPHFDIRIGIHTGAVTAGVVGKKRVKE